MLNFQRKFCIKSRTDWRQIYLDFFFVFFLLKCKFSCNILSAKDQSLHSAGCTSYTFAKTPEHGTGKCLAGIFTTLNFYDVSIFKGFALCLHQHQGEKIIIQKNRPKIFCRFMTKKCMLSASSPMAS